MQNSVSVMPSLPSEGFAKLPAVMSATGLSRSQLYFLMKRGDFPQQIHLGERAVAWPVESVRAWIASRIEQAKASTPAAEKAVA